jgi:ATP-dependent Clp protease ATP-binding subunit ClpA
LGSRGYNAREVLTDMRQTVVPLRNRRQEKEEATGLGGKLSSKIIGQSGAIEAIVPYVELFEAQLAPEGRPVGVFLLLGPTGTGKTKTVEALASALHGSERNVLRIDCGEFQLEHEVAKLIGAPPGYLGHRETQPMLNQQKLNAVSSERSGLSIVLLDEIEKAAPSMARLLLGVLDKATLRLGDNSVVNFERSLIFLTSNLGARDMMKEVGGKFGFGGFVEADKEALGQKLEAIGLSAVRKLFSPEFVNRVDRTLTYYPLERESFSKILDQQLADLQAHVNGRLGARAFRLDVSAAAREFLLDEGTSAEYGARELKRVIHRRLIQPLASLLTRGEIESAAIVYATVEKDGSEIELTPSPSNALPVESAA